MQHSPRQEETGGGGVWISTTQDFDMKNHGNYMVITVTMTMKVEPLALREQRLDTFPPVNVLVQLS